MHTRYAQVKLRDGARAKKLETVGGVPNPGFCWFLYFFGMGRNFRAQGQEKFDVLVIRHKTKQGRMWLVIKNGRLC